MSLRVRHEPALGAAVSSLASTFEGRRARVASMRVTIRIAASLSLAVLLASCVGLPAEPGAGAGAGGALSSPVAEALRGVWVLRSLKGAQSLEGQGFEAPTLVFGPALGMAARAAAEGAAGELEAEASGSGGCNSYGARCAFDDSGGLRFKDFWSTKMFCVDAPAETAYFAMLPRVRRYMLSERGLALLEEDGTLVAVFERPVPGPR